MPFDGPIPEWCRPVPPSDPPLSRRDKLVAVAIALFLFLFATADCWLLVRYLRGS
ncbi:hypothetical protein [Rhizosaccharibacter radicis]|uniref:Uncharacterized protein n=1 Tax=Rhizosaccharibacter radicis TaxID=2782605 RepID=A0ABT1W0M2_9PROT|nr:hypothetical protein [Acetobacteraceae bacterium KSS12]